MGTVYVWSLLLLALTCFSICAANTRPEQIAIAADDLEGYSAIVVTWVTFEPSYPDTSHVNYGPHGGELKYTEVGYMSMMSIGKNRYFHRVILHRLNPLTKYDYRCGSPSNWSDVMTFQTIADANSSVVLAVYGDLGTKNAVSLPYLKDDVKEGRIQGVLHLGDFAYDLQDDGGDNGDAFMNNIQPVASAVPYMTTPGNHEALGNFTHYKFRFFGMPGNNRGMYYSWSVGSAHIISISTEFFFNPDFQVDPAWQYNWLEEELERANGDRAKHPWIIMMGHRPMYCTTSGDSDCSKKESMVRTGQYGLEKLLYKYGVDIVFSGHMHIYERFWPLYDYKILNGTGANSNGYVNPLGPIHIIAGSAGNIEGHDAKFTIIQPPWTAFTSKDYGYTRMSVLNGTHIFMQQISTEQDGKVIDEYHIVQEHHGPFGSL